MTRPTPSRRKTVSLASAGTLVAGIAALAAGYWLRSRDTASPEHAAPDLAPDAPRPDGTDRAPVAFRPDPTAPVSAAERESLRPATGPSPSIVADRGGLRSGG